LADVVKDWGYNRADVVASASVVDGLSFVVVVGVVGVMGVVVVGAGGSSSCCCVTFGGLEATKYG